MSHSKDVIKKRFLYIPGHRLDVSGVRVKRFHGSTPEKRLNIEQWTALAWRQRKQHYKPRFLVLLRLYYHCLYVFYYCRGNSRHCSIEDISTIAHLTQPKFPRAWRNVGSTMHVQVCNYTFLQTSVFYWYRSFEFVNLLLIVCHKRLHLGFIVIRYDISSSIKWFIQFLVKPHIYNPFKLYYSPSLLTWSRPTESSNTYTSPWGGTGVCYSCSQH